jgi:nucleoside-diphosphate-sugar epimerase
VWQVRVALTGANGFLGSHVARALTRAGWPVTALVRKGADTKFLARLKNLTIVELEETSQPTLRAAMEGCDALVHAAALAKDWGRWEEFHEANVALTRRVLGAAAELGLKHVVHVSTNAVLGEEDCRRAKVETDPHAPRLPYFLEDAFPSAMNFYRRTKAEAESWATGFARERGLNLTVLRPVWIFGPRELHAGPSEYAKTVASGLPVFPGSDRNLFHPVYVGDVARAVKLALEKARPGVEVFNIGPPQVLPMATYFGYYCEALGRRRPRQLPKWLLYPAALGLELAATLARAKTPPLLTRARVYMFFADNVYDVGAAERALGFRAETDVRRAVRLTVRWWQQNGYL